MKEWDRACTPEFWASSVTIETVGKMLVMLREDVVTGLDGTDGRLVVGNAVLSTVDAQ